jgi:hypothetical protein
MTDAWRLMEMSDPADQMAVVAVALATLKGKAEIARLMRGR